MANSTGIVKLEPQGLLLGDIRSRIFTIRGEQVMLDRDLALLYGVETKVLNQAVKRNIERFPKEFMYPLNNHEFANLKSQFVTSNWGGDRHIPNVFTEQGVAMLSAVLKSPIAIQVSIGIMKAFVETRRVMVEQKQQAMDIDSLKLRLERLEDAMENNLALVNDLSEDLRAEVDNIYNAIGELSIKQRQLEEHPKPKFPSIGYEATAQRLKNESKEN